MCKRLICMLLCLSLVVCWPLTALAREKGSVLHIRSVEAFVTFAESCILDSYSQGLTVYLDCDLDLSGIEFGGVATFGGTFEGQNHRITGLKLSDDGSAVGLFRYLQTSALVKNLLVSGQVTPGGSAGTVGGIVGSNRGMLQNCHFEGSVSGKTAVGGIAGVNEASGCILRCSSRGVVVGENMTGGITGYNLGLVECCSNRSCVNIDTPDASLNLSDLDLSILTNPSALTAGLAIMDTGGIAGYCVGAVYDCSNYASIGYPHVGYNVGGIVGRSCGTVSGCVNQADIQGRKDVGGIVGQMEPALSLNLSEDYLQQLLQLLETLKTQTQDLRGSFSQLGAVQNHLNNTLDAVDGASSALEALAGYIGDYGDAMTSEINRASVILDDILQQMIPIVEQGTALSTSLAGGMEQLADALDAFAGAAAYLEQSISAMDRATAQLRGAGQSAADAMEYLAEGMKALSDAIQIEDQAQLEAALEQMSTGLSQLSQAMGQASQALQEIGRVMQQEGTWNEETAAAFGSLTQSLGAMGTALQSMSEGANLLFDSVSFSAPDFWAGVQLLEKGFDALRAAAESGTAAMDDLSEAFSALKETVQLGTQALEHLTAAAETFADSLRLVSQIGQSLETLLERIDRYRPIRLPSLNAGAGDSVDALFMNVNAISDELRSVLELSGQFSQEASQRLDALTATFEQLVSTAVALVNQVKQEAADGLISDTSDVDIDAVRAGKVSECRNTGLIRGDINVGGIAGAMTIEYQTDPEDDLKEALSDWQIRTYQAKAVIQNCTNLAQIQGKRDAIGGICGKMDLGIILQSGNYGDVSSSDGGFVGGIAGEAAGSIRRCSVKACLQGSDHVGGVAGLGVRVTDCHTMVRLTGGERTGAILGYAQQVTEDAIARNFYYELPGVSGAIDSVSYDGCAQEAAASEFLQIEGLDSRFTETVLTFQYEDGSSRELRLPVGAVLEAQSVPALENTQSEIQSWKDLEQYLGQAQYFDRVFTVERKPVVTVLESLQTRQDGKPLLLLQGNFASGEPVQLEPLEKTEGMLEGWRFALPDGSSVTQIRYLCPEGTDPAALQILLQGEDGSYHAVAAAQSGSYLVFEAAPGTQCFCVAQAPQEGMLLSVLIGAAVLTAVLAAVILLLYRRKSAKNPCHSREKK